MKQTAAAAGGGARALFKIKQNAPGTKLCTD